MATLNQAYKTLNMRRGVENALNNELKTRERVDRLERWQAAGEARLRRLEALSRAGLRDRLRWILKGSVDR